MQTQRITRGTYGEIHPSSTGTPAPATYGHAQAILAQAIRQGTLDAPYCDVDKKHRGSALNYDLFDFARGVALVQRRNTVCSKYGNSPTKSYWMLRRRAGKVTVTMAPGKATIAKLAKSDLPWGGVIAAITGAKPAKIKTAREQGEYYKAVAVVDGRYLSIFDGVTEYRLGETTAQQTARQDHGGGWYVYGTPRAAATAELPDRCALADAPRAILKVRAEGAYCRYGSDHDTSKLAFSRLTPLEVAAHQ